MVDQKSIIRDLAKIEKSPEFLAVAFLLFSGLLFLTRISYINILVKGWHFLSLPYFYLLWKYRLSATFTFLTALILLFFCPLFIFLKLATFTNDFYSTAIVLFFTGIIQYSNNDHY